MYSPGLSYRRGFIFRSSQSTMASTWRQSWRLAKARPWLRPESQACLACRPALPRCQPPRLHSSAAPAAHAGRRRKATKRHDHLALSISVSHGLSGCSVPDRCRGHSWAEWQRVAFLACHWQFYSAAWRGLCRWRSRLVPLRFIAAARRPPEPLHKAEWDRARARPGDAVPLAADGAIGGDIPSEPLGGGPTRELILGIGRFRLFSSCRRRHHGAGHPAWLSMSCDSAWTTDIFARSQHPAQSFARRRLTRMSGNRMAKCSAEPPLGLDCAALGGVLVPFLSPPDQDIAGLALVAAITAAGMGQAGWLLPLGLSTRLESPRALAIGAAMTVWHVTRVFLAGRGRAGLPRWARSARSSWKAAAGPYARDACLLAISFPPPRLNGKPARSAANVWYLNCIRLAKSLPPPSWVAMTLEISATDAPNAQSFPAGK